MAILYLTSSPTGPLDGSRVVIGLDKMNDFVVNLRKDWPDNARVLIITATPDNYSSNEEMQRFFANALRLDEFSFVCFDLLDRRNNSMSKEELQSYDVIFLGGGHVPTQNDFFKSVQLREKLIGYEGIIIGISAGTMNTADLLYAVPEEAGEAVNPYYQRFITGLGLIDTMLLPHYQMVKNYKKDGLRLYSDIVLVDSLWNGGQTFISLCDGSYLYAKDGKQFVYGEAWITANGEHRLLCTNDACKQLK